VINEADARAWIDAYAEAWVTRDSDRIVKIYAADAVFRERPFQPARHGIEAIRTYWESLVTEGQTDVHFQLEQLAVSGDMPFSTGRRISPGGRATASSSSTACRASGSPPKAATDCGSPAGSKAGSTRVTADGQ